MRTVLAALALLSLARPCAAQETRAPLTPAMERTIARLKEDAARSDLGFEITSDLVTNVGPRMAGTEAEARARDWAVAKFKALGFQARVEPFTMGMWRRTHESAALTAPFAAPLVISALGGSAPTPEGGIEAEIVRFPDIAALQAADAASVKGKIVFVDEKMVRSQDGSSYGAAQGKRRQCPLLAREKGAAACLIRTIGTSPLRVANTGNITSREGAIIPAAALSNPDADQIAALLAKGPVRVHLEIAVETKAGAPSGNVIAEIKGRERPDEIVLIAAHLDSWDITPGAQDDGTGVGAIMAAAKLIKTLPKHPRRTIRIVLFGSEEVGLLGGMEYLRAHKDELSKHVLATEADSGGGVKWRVRTKFGAGAGAHAGAMTHALSDLVIMPGDRPATGDSEVAMLAGVGVPVIDIDSDVYRYFDIHHTANDVIANVDPAIMRQHVAAYAVTAYIAAESDWDFRAAK